MASKRKRRLMLCFEKAVIVDLCRATGNIRRNAAENLITLHGGMMFSSPFYLRALLLFFQSPTHSSIDSIRPHSWHVSTRFKL